MMTSLAARRIKGRQVRKVIRDVVPKHLIDTFVVGCSGSAVVEWRNVRLGLKPEMKRTDSGEVGTEKEDGNEVIAGDVDIFCCGDVGLTDTKFQRFIQNVVRKMLDEGHKFESIEKRRNNYVHEDRHVWIVDIVLKNLAMKLSFVQCPCDENVMEAVQRFDFNMVRVMCDFSKNEFILDDQMEFDLDHRVMVLSMKFKVLVGKCIHESWSAPEQVTHFRRMKVASTHQRVKKHASRGFVLVDRDWWMDEMEEAAGEHLGEDDRVDSGTIGDAHEVFRMDDVCD